MYDLTIPIGICTPAWPTYEPLQMKILQAPQAQRRERTMLTHSNHVGTHLDGPMHFDTAGRDIASSRT
jgi:kynurenine formamidase